MLTKWALRGKSLLFATTIKMDHRRRFKTAIYFLVMAPYARIIFGPLTPGVTNSAPCGPSLRPKPLHLLPVLTVNDKIVTLIGVACCIDQVIDVRE